MVKRAVIAKKPSRKEGKLVLSLRGGFAAKYVKPVVETVRRKTKKVEIVEELLALAKEFVRQGTSQRKP